MSEKRRHSERFRFVTGHDWRTGADLQGFWAEHRLREPRLCVTSPNRGRADSRAIARNGRALGAATLGGATLVRCLAEAARTHPPFVRTTAPCHPRS
jgi:hypothetical protein